MLTDPVWFIHQILGLEVGIYLIGLHDFQPQMLEIFHLAFSLVIHGELNQTIPLTTPSSSYFKRQYLKPQIKQAHLSIKLPPSPPPPSKMFEINKLPLCPTPTTPFEGFTEGFRSQLAVWKKYINSKLILTATKRWRNNQNQIEKRKIYFQ